MLRKKLMIGFGLAALLAGGLLVATAAAEPPTPTGSDAKVSFYDSFITKLAQNLGIAKETLTNAVTQTRNQVIDEAVSQGKLTQQQGEKLKSREDGWVGPHPFGGRGWRGQPGRVGMVGRDVVVQALANLLHKTPADVGSELQSGKTVDQVLKENNLTEAQLRDAVIGLAKEKLDQAVAEGKLTKDQETKILDRMKDAPLNVSIWRKGFGPCRSCQNQGGNPTPAPSR